MRKKIKDLTFEELNTICSNSKQKCRKCQLKKEECPYMTPFYKLPLEREIEFDE